MNKVWILTAGAYSDYHIEGVFSTREAAYQTYAVLGGADRDYNEPEEFDLSVSPWGTVRVYRVSWDGTENTPFPRLNARVEIEVLGNQKPVTGHSNGIHDGGFRKWGPSVFVEGTDREAVTKSASERIAQAIAEHGLPLTVPEIVYA